jgi:hypothetical protein
MPVVNGKKYPYTEEGKKAAKRAEKDTVPKSTKTKKSSAKKKIVKRGIFNNKRGM